MGTAQAVSVGKREHSGQKRKEIESKKEVRHSLSEANKPSPARSTSLPSPSGSSMSKISGKGQITLPVLVRDRLGVKPGDEVEFVFDGERTLVRPVRGENNPFERWIGVAKDVPSHFDVSDWISGMRDDENRRLDLQEMKVANGG